MIRRARQKPLELMYLEEDPEKRRSDANRNTKTLATRKGRKKKQVSRPVDSY